MALIFIRVVSEFMFVIIVLLFGLAIGSFVNVLIDRLPRGESVITGRSHCDYCGRTLNWSELLPVISWVIQGGRCRHCHKKLSPQYPVIELFTALGLSGLYIWAGSPLEPVNFLPVISYWVIFVSFLVIFVSDFKYQIIPDSMVVLGLIGTAGAVGLKAENLYAGLGASLFFLILYLLTRGRGMGFGDVKLAFLMGYIAGFPKIVTAIYIAFLTGAAAGVILIIGGKKKLKSKISFGPFLILGLVAALIFGDKLTVWFLKIF